VYQPALVSEFEWRHDGRRAQPKGLP
jgi:hypothetical protein